MHCVYGESHSSLLIESTDSMILVCSPNTYASIGVFNPNTPIFQTNCAKGLQVSAFHCPSSTEVALIYPFTFPLSGHCFHLV